MLVDSTCASGKTPFGVADSGFLNPAAEAASLRFPLPAEDHQAGGRVRCGGHKLDDESSCRQSPDREPVSKSVVSYQLPVKTVNTGRTRSSASLPIFGLGRRCRAAISTITIVKWSHYFLSNHAEGIKKEKDQRENFSLVTEVQALSRLDLIIE